MTRKRRKRARERKPQAGLPRARPEQGGEPAPMVRELVAHHEVSPAATGGDVDADWQRAESVGEEAVGGSVATPDQDVVDEIGRALGVEQSADAPVQTSEEILRARDRHYWHLERLASERENGE